MLTDRGVLWAFVVGLVLWLVSLTQWIATGNDLAMVSMGCASIAIAMVIARPWVFGQPPGESDEGEAGQ